MDELPGATIRSEIAKQSSCHKCGKLRTLVTETYRDKAGKVNLYTFWLCKHCGSRGVVGEQIYAKSLS